jgi:hypothetical protein
MPQVFLISKLGRTLLGLALMILFANASCNTLPPTLERVTPSSAATSPADNPTAGAIARSTRQAQATKNAQTTATAAQATLAAKSTEIAFKATGTARAIAAQATGQAVFVAKSGWPRLLSEPFKDNHLGWPVGLTKDHSLAVTSQMADGSYQWITTVKTGNSYFNLIPEKGPLLSNFYAKVAVQFVGGDDDQLAYGITFCNVKDDYGFFGISKSGSFRILEVHHTGIYQLDQESSSEIDTEAGHTNQIAVVAVGPDFAFLINDQVVGQMSADLDPGQIGLGVDALTSAPEEQVTFSNFEIYAPKK